MNPLRKLTDWFAKSRRRPIVRRSCPLTVEALDERILLSTTAILVKDINPPSPSTISVPSSNPANLTNVNGTLFFTAADATHGIELWKSNGTDAGTVMVRDIRLGSAGSAPADLTVVGSTLYFTADDGANGRELWKSDGTLTGTRMVNNVRPGALGSAPDDLTAVGSTLYFTADNGATGQELWKSDGTTSGTVLVRDLRPGATGSSPSQLTAVGSRLYLTADDGVHGMELWQSNGTAAGTYLINLNTFHSGLDGTEEGSSPTNLTAVGSTLYCYALLADSWTGLWDRAIYWNDGATDDRGQIGHGISEFENLTNVDGNLYFTANDGQFDTRFLYRVQGLNNKSKVSQTNFDLGPPSNLTVVNGILYFSASVQSGNRELWKYDGTTVVEVANINAGGSSNPASLTNVNGTLYFTANDGVNGTELWQSDGTSAGTRMVRNLHSSGGSSPGSLTNVNGTLYFAANNGFTGTELYKTRANTAPSVNTILANIAYREGRTMSVLTTSSDADGDVLTFSAAGLPAGMSINRLTGTISGTLAYSAGRSTPYTVTVTASDGFESSRVSFPWTVCDITAPTIVNPGTQGSNEGNVVSLAISASDPHGDALSYSAVGLPAGLAINPSTGMISGTFGWQSGGSYQVTVTATDGVNPVATTFTWNVGDLMPPTIINPGPQHSIRGNTITLDILASDPNGDPLTFTAVKLPLGLSINPTTGRISGTISMSALPSCEVMIQVSDGINTSSIVFVWTVG